MRKLKLGICILAIFCSTLILNAQATIGSAYAPRKGVLLDLKENNNSGANSDKGLLLPRVRLVTNDLKSLGVTDEKKHEAHTGLLVVNMTDDKCDEVQNGLYVWDGTSWKGINSPQPSVVKDQTNFDEATGILTDYEGHEYKTKNFGGVTWMLQNLYALRDKDGKSLKEYDGGMGLINAAGAEESIQLRCDNAYDTTQVISYEVHDFEGAIPSWKDVEYTTRKFSQKEFAAQHGLLYHQTIAQKICPKGWKIPTIQEWINLLKLITKDNAGIPDYGSVRAGSSIFRYGHRYSIWIGTDAGDPYRSGFEVLPTGAVYEDKIETVYFFSEAFFWAEEDNARARIPDTINEPIDVRVTRPNLHFSVRCIKEN